MTEMSVGFLPEDRRLFRPTESLGAALREVARTFAPQNTAKAAQRRWNLDPSTAENITKGTASGATVVKAVRAEGSDAWALWDALGELLIGESRDEYDERKLQIILEETRLAQSRIAERRARRSALEARASELCQVADR